MSQSDRSDPLDGVLAKLERANEHYAELNAEIRTYLASEPYVVVRQEHPDWEGSGDDYVSFVLRLREEAPIRLGVVLGDCAHNLRSSLDHLAWQLVVAAGNEPKGGPGGTQFPIVEAIPKKVVAIVGGVDPKALLVIDSHQPYHLGDDAPLHSLSVIRTISNTDKHQNLLLASAYVFNASANLVDRTTGQVLSNPVDKGFLYDDAVIGWYKRTPDGLLSQPDTVIDGTGSATVSLRDLPEYEYVPVQLPIENAIAFVGETLVPKLRPFIT